MIQERHSYKLKEIISEVYPDDYIFVEGIGVPAKDAESDSLFMSILNSYVRVYRIDTEGTVRHYMTALIGSED